jgi:hypothetical protein
MDDFLNSLVTRNLGDGAVVRPRPASVFEPGPDEAPRGDLLEAVAIDEEVSVVTEARAIDGAGPLRRSAGEATGVAAPAPAASPTRAASEGAATSSAGSPAVEPRRVGPELPAPTAPPPHSTRERLARRPSRPSAPSPVVPIAQADSRSAAAPASQPLDPERARLRDRQDTFSSAVEPALSVSQSLPSLEPARRRREDSTPATPLSVRPRAAPSEPAPPRHAGPAPPGPAIHVTIGRIEVRATTPASAPRAKERPAPPVMTLDEYLRERVRQARA